MRRCAVFVAAVLLLTVQPARGETPATKAASEPGVLVLPFEPLAGGGTEDDAAAVARVMHRSLVVDLSRVRNLHTVESKKVAPDRDAAIAEGKADGAKFVVWGTVQYVEGRVRVNGEVLDVETADAAGRFKVTGRLRELFELQDLVAEQVRRHVANPAKPNGAEPRAEGATDEAEPEEVPAGKPLRARPREHVPGWAHPPALLRNDITARYNYGYTSDWYSPYWRYPSRYYYGYHGYGYRPYRPLGYRLSDYHYTYDGLPDRRLHRRFGALDELYGPLPLRWLRRY
jgi:TolB-like protein